MKPNTQFTLTVEDIECIEHALIQQIGKLLERRQAHVESTIIPEGELKPVKQIDDEIKSIYQLLGRIHNQKSWYRPKHNYVGG